MISDSSRSSRPQISRTLSSSIELRRVALEQGLVLPVLDEFSRCKDPDLRVMGVKHILMIIPRSAMFDGGISILK